MKAQNQITTFKGGDIYRFGIQLQKKTGEWSEPIYLDDVVNTRYPYQTIDSSQANKVRLPYAELSNFPITEIISDYDNKHDDKFLDIYENIRPVVVFPTIADRNVLCQGVLNPTVFNVQDRIDNSPYAQASWFFRPMTSLKEAVENVTNSPSVLRQDIPSSPILDPDEEFKNYTCKVSTIIGTFINDEIKEDALSRGVLTTDAYASGSVIRKYEIAFWGAIHLEGNKYIFFRNYEEDRYNKFEIFSPSGVSSTQKLKYNGIFSSYEIRNIFQLYKGLYIDANHLFFYAQNIASLPSIYNVYCYEGDRGETTNNYYTVSFPSNTVTEMDPNGSSLRFKHYDSIYSDSIEGINASKQVEIQGSRDVFSSAFDTSTNNTSAINHLSSNTQFMVDQSIVTLNSPDIEFDTDVQNYSTNS